MSENILAITASFSNNYN